MTTQPIIFLSFANDRQHPERFLKALELERTALHRVLSDYQTKGWGLYHSAGSSEPADLKKDFSQHSGSMIIFHFSGHANGTQLQLEGSTGESISLTGNNLLAFLRGEVQLKLVFLNACATREHVERLFSIGIPAVIATDMWITDKKARIFAESFYTDLVQGKSLQTAFAAARAVIMPGDDQERIYRSLDTSTLAADSFPWGLYVQKEKMLQWKLEPKIATLLAEGSRQFYHQLTAPTGEGRFRHLKISDLLLTGVEGKFLDVTLKRDDQEYSLSESLESLWTQNPAHAILLGEGGMGKTVSLVRLWEQFTKQEPVEGPVSVFVALNEYNTDPNQSGFLTHYLIRNYLGKNTPTAEDRNRLWEWLREDWDQPYPKLILLLDGFNEITVDKTQLLIDMQREWRQKARGVQIILSSRYGSNLTWTEDFHTMELQPLDETRSSQYLLDEGLTYPSELRLASLIGNPMMLSLFAVTSEIMDRYREDPRYAFKPQISSTAELIWNFMEAQLVKYDSAVLHDTLKQAYCRWLFRHLLPAIGFAMTNAGRYDLERNELREIIERYLAACRKASYADLLIETFPDCEAWWEQLEEGPGPGFSQLRDELVGHFMMLIREEKLFRFLHQGFRDYFAAIHIYNKIQLGFAADQIPVYLTKRTLPRYLRQMLGGLAGLHNFSGKAIDRNQDKKSHIGSLMELLERCRGRFQANKPGYTVWNLLNIIREAKGELIGMDLQRLDLSKIRLNYIKTSQSNNYVNFDQSLLREIDFFSSGHKEWVSAITYSQDGLRIASGSEDQMIKEWDALTGECLRTYVGHNEMVTKLIYSPDGSRLISGAKDHIIKEWDTQTGKCLHIYPDFQYEGSMAYHPAGTHIAYICYKTNLVIEYSTKNKDLFQYYHNRFLTVHYCGVAYSPDGSRIIAGCNSVRRKVIGWSTETKEQISSPYKAFLFKDIIEQVEYSPCGKRLIAASRDGILKEWSIRTGECLMTIYLENEKSLNALKYHPSGNRVITVSKHNIIREWSTKTGECLRIFDKDVIGTSIMTSVVYNPSGSKLAFASLDCSFNEVSSLTGEWIRTYYGPSQRISALFFRQGGKRLIFGSWDDTIKEWDFHTGKCLRIYHANTKMIHALTSNRDESRLYSGSWDHTIKEWSTETGECIRTFYGHNGVVSSLVCSPDSTRLYSGSWDHTIKEWSTETGECLRTIESGLGPIYSLDCNINGKRFIAAGDRGIKEWHIQTGESFHLLGTKIYSVSYSPNGKRFIANPMGIIAEVFSKSEKKFYHDVKSKLQESYVLTLAYSPDGKKIATGSEDYTVREWDISTGKCIIIYEGHQESVTVVAYSPNARKIISCSIDGTIKEWSTETGECLRTWPNIPGLIIQNCSFKNLHPASELSEEAIELMKLYGARFE